ncbi:MAG: FAD-dependent oxidoreductase, partial [Myxococcaceae bacterium]
MYDVIIIGARCAGASTGLLLARRGFRVLLLERGTFPSDTLSTHMIHESGIARLRRWSLELAEQIRASGCPAISRSYTDLDELRYSAQHLPVDGNVEAFAPRRTVLDHLLVQAAVKAGCELREGFRAEGLVWDGTAVSGVRGRTRAGAAVVERARLTVGADGKHSLVAREVGAALYNTRPKTTCTYYSYFSDAGLEGTVLVPRENRMLVAVPTNDGLAVVTVICPVAEFPSFREDIERHYFESIRRSPLLAERILPGRREAPFKGTADLPFFYRSAGGEGWALVGDAAHCKDPILAQGISDAFRDAEGIAGAMETGWSGSASLEETLARHEAQRNEATADLYNFTYELSLLHGLSAPKRRLFAACQQ